MKLHARLFVGAVVPLACFGTAHACDIPDGWSVMKGEGAELQIALNVPTKFSKISERFDLEVKLCGEGSKDIERIVVDANMPAHRHGMNYTPVKTMLEAGHYKASGLLFHMPGQWQIIVDTFSASISQRHTLDVIAK